jgi:hypothetical protein
MGVGQRFSFALERDDVRARRWNCLGCNDRRALVFGFWGRDFGVVPEY